MIARLTLYWFDNLHVIFQLDALFFSGLRLGSTVSVDLRPETVRKAMGGSPRVRGDPNLTTLPAQGTPPRPSRLRAPAAPHQGGLQDFTDCGEFAWRGPPPPRSKGVASATIRCSRRETTGPKRWILSPRSRSYPCGEAQPNARH